MTSRAFPEILPLDVGTFTFPADEPYAGELGVVVAYAIRRREGVLLFDTGFGFGNAFLDERYHPQGPLMRDVLGEGGIRVNGIDLIANCHLHPDHAGQNVSFPHIPIHVQRAELAAARAGDYTILEWVDGPNVDYVEADGDHDLVPGIRVVATPGHSSDSLSFHLPAEHAVLTGDTILGRGTTVVAHPDGRLGEYLDSLQRLRNLCEHAGATTILPGHGPVLGDALSVLDYYIAHRAERLAQVEAAVAAGARTAREVVEMVYVDVDQSLWGAAELSVRAQLDYLDERD